MPLLPLGGIGGEGATKWVFIAAVTTQKKRVAAQVPLRARPERGIGEVRFRCRCFGRLSAGVVDTLDESGLPSCDTCGDSYCPLPADL